MECWISIWASCTYLPSPSLFGALSTHAPLSDRSSEEKTVRAVSDTNQHGSAILASHLDHVYIYIYTSTHVCAYGREVGVRASGRGMCELRDLRQRPRGRCSRIVSQIAFGVP